MTSQTRSVVSLQIGSRGSSMTHFYLKDEHGYQINQFRLYPKLGLGAGSHLPKEGFGPRLVEGVTFKCDPASGDGNRSPHRVRYHCPACDMWVPFGRAVQHESGAAHKDNADYYQHGPRDTNSSPEFD